MRARIPWKILGVGGAALLLGGLAVFAWMRQPTRTHVYTDADTIRAEESTVDPRDVLWQPPTALAAEINTTAQDYEPQLSWDGMTLYFVRGKAGENADLFVSHRTPDGWTPPEPLAALNSEYDELGPEPSRDGTALYFYSDRPGGAGGYDIWVARRTGDDWETPENLGPAINGPYNDYGPALTPDDGLLYFASNRPLPEDTQVPDPDAWPATVREQFLHRTYDLYSAPRTARGFGAARPVEETLTPHNEATPAVSPTGDFLYFASDRPGGVGGFDLYRARRIDGTLREAVGLRSPVNTPANELDPGLTQLGYGLYFSSDRLLLPPENPAVQADTPAETVVAGAERPDYNLYYSASREVFLEVEETPPLPIDWAAMLPWLLWLLLALLLLATLLALWGALREKRLGLLARCLLASLLAHLLLLLLFSFLHVTEQVMSGFNKKPEIRISLASPSQTSILAAQVRPDPADRPTLPAEAIELQAVETVPVQQTMPEMVTTEAPRATPEVASVQRDAPREAEPIARRPDTPAPSLRPETEPLTMPVPDEVIAESAPETSTEAIAATLERPQFEATPPRFATSQPVRAPFEIEPGDALAAALELPSTRRGMTEAQHTRARATPTPRAVATPTEMSLDLPQEAAAVASADETPDPIASSATGLLTPDALEVRPPQLQLAVSIEPLEATEQAFELASSVTPVTREARPSISRATAAPQRRPTAPADLPLALFDEAPQAEPTPSPAAPQYASQQVELTPAGIVAAPVTHRFEPSVANDVTPTRESLALPRAVPTAAMREARATTRNLLPTAPTAPAALPLAMDLALPTETEAPARPSALAHRTTPQRRELLEELGGDTETEAAVQRALAWLARHQSDHGGWDGLYFDRGCGGCQGTSEYAIDSAVTGLSLLCFLGAGHVHTEDGPYRQNVARGIAWLLKQQDDSGSLSPNETLYSHGIATIAIAEAYALTGDRALYQPLQAAVHYIAVSANPRTGGWRYQPGEEADTSVTGWQVMALASARTAGLAIPQEALRSAETWLDTAQRRPGLYVYQPGQRTSVTMTAEAMFMRQLLGRDRGERDMQASARLISRDLPDWDEVDTYRWYYTTLALFHHQGDAWPRWNDALKRELLANQRGGGGKPDGSWDPAGPWADVGGRVYQTALCTLMLETYYRYLPMYAERAPVAQEPGDPVGRIYGRVYDSASGAPLAEARVRLDRPDGDPLEVTTDALGEYSLDIPQMPEHFAIAASRSGYLPRALGAEAAALADGRLQMNFALEPIGSEVLALEDPPQVHHLGNDRWEGRINSQFQRSAEGQRLRLGFVLAEEWDPRRVDEVVLTFLAKGVQCPHRVRINGRALQQRLDESPDDGSYGTVRLVFPPELLTAGVNTFELRSSSCAGDVDDFEFLNVQLRFAGQ